MRCTRQLGCTMLRVLDNFTANMHLPFRFSEHGSSSPSDEAPKAEHTHRTVKRISSKQARQLCHVSSKNSEIVGTCVHTCSTPGLSLSLRLRRAARRRRRDMIDGSDQDASPRDNKAANPPYVVLGHRRHAYCWKATEVNSGRFMCCPTCHLGVEILIWRLCVSRPF